MRCSTLALLLISPMLLPGQEMLLSEGTILVHEGTTLEINGYVDWSIATGAQVVNNGRIELRDNARLSEAEGWPVIGSGTEHAWVIEGTALTTIQPGGLGLEFTSGIPAAAMEVIRAHQPITMANDEESVARWFHVIGTIPELDQLEFYFDATELNGLLETDLDLYDALQLDGPWIPMLAFNGADLHSMIATNAHPRQFITAFHRDAAVSTSTASADPGMRIWPTVTTDMVNIHSSKGEVIQLVELFDAQGRAMVLDERPVSSGSSMVMDLSAFANGSFILRINGRHLFKLVKA